MQAVSLRRVANPPARCFEHAPTRAGWRQLATRGRMASKPAFRSHRERTGETACPTFSYQGYAARWHWRKRLLHPSTFFLFRPRSRPRRLAQHELRVNHDFTVGHLRLTNLRNQPVTNDSPDPVARYMQGRERR